MQNYMGMVCYRTHVSARSSSKRLNTFFSPITHLFSPISDPTQVLWHSCVPIWDVVADDSQHMLHAVALSACIGKQNTGKR